MKIACQEGMAVGASLPEKLDKLAEAGYDGIELNGSGLSDRVDQVSRALAGHQVKPSSICGGVRAALLDPDLTERKKAVEDIKSLLQVAGTLGATGVIVVPIFGPPRIPDLSPYRSAVELEKDLLCRLCEELGEAAEASGSLVLLEPLNRYETHLLRSLSDAVDVCRRIGSPGIRIMADFFHMSIEEADLPASIRSAGSHIAHVHLADSTRQLPGLGHTDFRSGFAALREAGFDGYMALECGNPSEDRQAGLTQCARFLREQMM